MEKGKLEARDAAVVLGATDEQVAEWSAQWQDAQDNPPPLRPKGVPLTIDEVKQDLGYITVDGQQLFIGCLDKFILASLIPGHERVVSGRGRSRVTEIVYLQEDVDRFRAALSIAPRVREMDAVLSELERRVEQLPAMVNEIQMIVARAHYQSWRDDESQEAKEIEAIAVLGHAFEIGECETQINELKDILESYTRNWSGIRTTATD